MSDDQDSDTIKFEDAINDSEASTKKRLLGIEAKVSRLKESQGSAGVIISSTEIAEEEKKEEQDNSDEVRTTKEGLDSSQNEAAGNTRRLDVGRDSRKLCASNEFENEDKGDLQQILMEKL